MVLKKGKKDSSTLFIDATGECIKITNNNKLTPENIDNIVAEYASREDKDHFARLVPYDEIRENNNTNIAYQSFLHQKVSSRYGSGIYTSHRPKFWDRV